MSVSAAGWNSCPFCNQTMRLPRSAVADTFCPACGRRLWHIAGPQNAWFFGTEAELVQILLFMEEQDLWSEQGADSLDLVELSIELEERLHSSL
jgi:hypothetical protein